MEAGHLASYLLQISSCLGIDTLDSAFTQLHSIICCSGLLITKQLLIYSGADQTKWAKSQKPENLFPGEKPRLGISILFCNTVSLTLILIFIGAWS